MANRLYQFLHPAVQLMTDASPTPVITTSVAASASSLATVNVPRQVMEQLSTFFQQFSHPPPCENTVLSTTQDTLPNNSSINAVNDTPDVDEVLSAASDPIGPSTSYFPVMNNAKCTLVPVHLQPTTV